MKELKFLVATLFVALLPIMFTSCGEKNDPEDETGVPSEITLVGKWEVTEAIRLDGEVKNPSEETGQVWTFTDTELTVSDVEGTFEYKLSNNNLITSYAANYHTTASYFTVDRYESTQMTLSISYIKPGKPGGQTNSTNITHTLTFKRIE